MPHRRSLQSTSQMKCPLDVQLDTGVRQREPAFMQATVRSLARVKLADWACGISDYRRARIDAVPVATARLQGRLRRLFAVDVSQNYRRGELTTQRLGPNLVIIGTGWYPRVGAH